MEYIALNDEFDKEESLRLWLKCWNKGDNMIWFNSFEKAPKKGELIWVWDTHSQKQMLFSVSKEEEWDPIKIPYLPIWSYVFEQKPENPNGMDQG